MNLDQEKAADAEDACSKNPDQGDHGRFRDGTDHGSVFCGNKHAVVSGGPNLKLGLIKTRSSSSVQCNDIAHKNINGVCI